MGSARTLDVRHQYFETNGIRIHAAVQGADDTAEGKRGRGTIVFLHGFPEFWYCWRDQIPEFATDFRVVAPDLRGYNLSDKPEGVENYKVRTVVADIAGIIEQLDDENTILIAHDWGGSIAWALAAFHPELIRKLIIINAAHPSTFLRDLAQDPKQQSQAQYIHMLRSADGERQLSENGFAQLKEFLMASMVDPYSLSDEVVERYVKAWNQPGALTGMLSYYRAMPAPPPKLESDGSESRGGKDEPRADLGRVPRIMIHVPTLVVWGMQDTALMPSLLDGLEEFVPDLKVVRIPEGSHWVMHERPDEVNAAIREYLD